MARIRSLKPSFFLNEELAKLTPLHRLLFQGLWVIADRKGRLHDKPGTIKVQTLPFDNCDVDSMLNDLAMGDDPFITRYQVDCKRYIQVVSFLRHQNPHHKEADSDIPANSGAKTSNPVPAPTQTSASTDLGKLEPCGCGSGNGSGNGSGSGNGESEPPSLSNSQSVVTIFRPNRPIEDSIGSDRRRHLNCIGSGNWWSCMRGRCVPVKLVKDWQAQGFTEVYIKALVEDYILPIPEGTALPSDGFKLWGAVWDAVHQTGQHVPNSKPSNGDSTMAAARRLAAKFEAEAKEAK